MCGDWGWWRFRSSGRSRQPALGGQKSPFWGITWWKLWNGQGEVGFISQQVLGVQKCIKAGGRLDLVSPAWSHPSPEGGEWGGLSLGGRHQGTCILDLPWFQFSCGTLSNGPGSPGSPLSWPHMERLNYLKISLPPWLLHSCITLWV